MDSCSQIGPVTPGIAVETIAPESPHLDAVIELWGKHRQTLGFFPEGAFRERAARGQILVATGERGCCLGYLVYFTSRRRATITHLCVDERARGRGVAKMLIERLCQETKHVEGIGLHCRRDFDACNAWPKLGFRAVSQKTGRGRGGAVLTCFWLDHGHPDLFSSVTGCEEERLNAAIDANIFFDLIDPDREVREETTGLVADWLRPLVNLYVTDELFNEINHNPDDRAREEMWGKARQFERLECSVDDFQDACRRVRQLVGPPQCERDGADQRQLARAIASNASVFVTRDGILLKAADGIYDEYGLSIVRPAELITRLDELRDEREYQPARLAGTRIRTGRARFDEDRLATCFLAPSGERMGELKGRLRRFFAHPERFTCRVVAESDDRPLAVCVTDSSRPGLLAAPLIRTSQSRLAGTLSRTLLRSLVLEAAESSCTAVVTDPHPPTELLEALRDSGFLPAEGGWFKAAFRSIESCERTAEILSGILDPDGVPAAAASAIVDLLRSGRLQHDPVTASAVEHILWPTKLADCDMPGFIVPIRPRWAEHLFDEGLANQSLFGADTELALNPESVYYRARTPGILRAPGRILWYVSADRAIPGSKCIRACSRLKEIVIGRPKDLFRQFRRMGVYAWRDVFATARNDLETEIMAVRFDDSEVLNPVPWDELQEILRRNSIRSNLQSPIEIPTGLFCQIYRRASGF